MAVPVHRDEHGMHDSVLTNLRSSFHFSRLFRSHFSYAPSHVRRRPGR